MTRVPSLRPRPAASCVCHAPVRRVPGLLMGLLGLLMQGMWMLRLLMVSLLTVSLLTVSLAEGHRSYPPPDHQPRCHFYLHQYPSHFHHRPFRHPISPPRASLPPPSHPLSHPLLHPISHPLSHPLLHPISHPLSYPLSHPLLHPLSYPSLHPSLRPLSTCQCHVQCALSPCPARVDRLSSAV